MDYLVDVHDRRKRKRLYHVNMLRKWHVPTGAGYFTEEVDTATDEDIPVWNDPMGGGPEQATIGSQLDQEQKGELAGLLNEFADVFQAKPGRTTLVEHHIRTRRKPSHDDFRHIEFHKRTRQKSRRRSRRCSQTGLSSHQQANGALRWSS